MLGTACQDEVYLNLVLEYIPETIHRGIRNFARLKQTMPMLHVKVRVGAGVPFPVSCLCQDAEVAGRGVRFASPGPSQLYMYQLFRSLAYIHFMGICHRDIKPQNLLLDPQAGVLKLCDFGRCAREHRRPRFPRLDAALSG